MKAWSIFVIIIVAIVLISAMFFVSNLGEEVESEFDDIINTPGIPQEPTEKEKHLCSEYWENSPYKLGGQKIRACPTIYIPNSTVCGWFNPEKIQCIKYPCAQNYSDSCNACLNPDVLYWTEGLCPVG